MDQETNKPQEQTPFPAAPVAEKSPLAMIVGVVGFVVVLLGVGWFMMGMAKPSQELVVSPPASTAETATTSEDAAAAALSTQGSSDDVTSIDADLKATNLDSLDDINKI